MDEVVLDIVFSETLLVSPFMNNLLRSNQWSKLEVKLQGSNLKCHRLISRIIILNTKISQRPKTTSRLRSTVMMKHRVLKTLIHHSVLIFHEKIRVTLVASNRKVLRAMSKKIPCHRTKRSDGEKKCKQLPYLSHSKSISTREI